MIRFLKAAVQGGDTVEAIFYLYRRTMANRIRMALRKPITYVYLVFICFYMVLLPFSFSVMLQEISFDSPQGMAAVMTALAFFILPSNFITYAKRKGLLYRKSDVHFLFPSPVGAKKVLIYAYLKTLLMSVIMNLLGAVLGAVLFHVVWWKLIIYFVFSVFVEDMLEACIMIFIYGNEFMGERGRRIFAAGVYALLGLLVVIGIYYYSGYGLSMETLSLFLHSNQVQLVPVIGWYIAALHLLFVGPTVINVAGTAAYLIFCVVMLIIVFRMRCRGEYYEDAMSFADDYEEAIERKKSGEAARIGKRKKFGKASVVYKGRGAKAIFYRQLLEYKKNRFFILDSTSLVMLGVGALLAYLCTGNGGMEASDYILPCASAYMVLIFSALNGKWGKELASPYTYLLPDNNFKKLWYATLMQNIQAVINGTLMMLPAAVIIGMPPVTVMLSILFYVILNANKLYALAVAEVAVGNVLGRYGKQMFQLFIQMLAAGTTAVCGIVSYAAFGIDIAYLLMNVILALVTVIFMIIAALNFNRMEKA